MKIYTRKGDDGTTGLLYGGRVRKDAPPPPACGDVDEAQAALGLARATAERRGLGARRLLVGLERDLWVLMAEVATAPEQPGPLVAGRTLVTAEMVDALEPLIDDLTGRFDPPASSSCPARPRCPPPSTWPAPSCAGPSAARWPWPPTARSSSPT